MPTQFCWIYTTTPTKKEAQKISDLLLKKKLIACANIFPAIESRYRWQGKTQRSKEFAVIFKTRTSHSKKVEHEILRAHTYECPCIIQINWKATTHGFAKWVTEETNQNSVKKLKTMTRL